MNFIKGYELWLLVIPLLIFCLLIYFYGFDMRGAGEGSVLIRGRTFSVDIADTPVEKQKGLAGRGYLDQNYGLLFVFDRPSIHRFWMRGMIIPIDIIWIHDGKVVGFEKNAQPEPGVPTRNLKIYSPEVPVEYVLEVRAGTVNRSDINIGDDASIRL